MANVRKRSIDSVKRSSLRKQSYEAPAIKRKTSSKRPVPQEYRTFKKAPKGRGGLVFFLFLLFIAAISGFWYWNNNGSTNITDSLKLEITGPEKIVSGDEVTYLVEYTNLDTVALTAMELSVYWPAGFYFDEASLEPENANAKTWLLDDLPAGQKASLEIKGQLVGKKGEEHDAIFSLDYQPANFHSDFVAKQTVTTKITDQKIELEVQGLEKTLVDTEQEIKIVYRNLSEEVLTDLYLDVLYPDDWQIESVEPAKEGQYWVSSLEPEEEKEIVLKGYFSIDSRADQLLVAEVGNMFDNDFRRLMRTEHPIVVVNPQFDLNLTINGQKGDQQANWGDVLRYQLEVTNASDSDIADVEVTALLAGKLLNWDSLDSVGQYLEERIVWTNEEDQGLASWSAGEKKIFTWEVKIVSSPQPERNLENIIKINIAGLNDWEQLVTVSKLTVGESLTFNNGIYWHLGGRRVGSGLLPPRVGEETQYLVVWSLPQSTGNFADVKVETVLPPNVDFVDQAEIQEGTLSFDESSRSLTWSLNDFQDVLLPVTASFMISITPDNEDKGQTLTLLNPVTVSASGTEDVVVRSKILKTSDVVAESSEPIGIVQ
ncbi:DUF11 domain-containing protein [Candidatus Nomurabacteria bacterium]|nr:DUF11 domain-containing protein [Candidatus Nomurabacteria bacterium]